LQLELPIIRRIRSIPVKITCSTAIALVGSGQKSRKSSPDGGVFLGWLPRAKKRAGFLGRSPARLNARRCGNQTAAPRFLSANQPACGLCTQPRHIHYRIMTADGHFFVEHGLV